MTTRTVVEHRRWVPPTRDRVPIMVHPRVREALNVLLMHHEAFMSSGVGFSEFIANAINLYDPDLLDLSGPVSRQDAFEAFAWRIHNRSADPYDGADYDVLCPVSIEGMYCDYVAGHSFGHQPSRSGKQPVPDEWSNE